MLSSDVKSDIINQLGYGGYGENCNEIGLMLSVPCESCSGKGHSEYNRMLDNFTSLEDVKCKACDGKGYELRRITFFESFHKILARLIEEDDDIQEAIIKAISKNATHVIDSLKTALVSDVMET